MARYAIVRQGGEVDKVDGSSVDDVANRYGWPGDGNIEAWDDGAHAEKLRNTYASPEEQTAALADKPKGKGTSGGDTTDGPSRADLVAEAERRGLATSGTKAELAERIEDDDKGVDNSTPFRARDTTGTVDKTGSADTSKGSN